MSRLLTQDHEGPLCMYVHAAWSLSAIRFYELSTELASFGVQACLLAFGAVLAAVHRFLVAHDLDDPTKV